MCFNDAVILTSVAVTTEGRPVQGTDGNFKPLMNGENRQLWIYKNIS